MRYEVAIGDVHGCYEELVELLKLIDASFLPTDEVQLIFLGDYVDRGPRSRDVVELVKNLPSAICLKGNHEELLLEAYVNDDANDETHYLSQGGRETLTSYGQGGDLKSSIPYSHVKWIDELPIYLETEHRYFVHAGFMPGYAAVEQQEEWCLWIRDKFLGCKDTAVWPKHIVHGHTPVHRFGKTELDQPELLTWRTNVDTGCCWTGVLTAAVFDASRPGRPVRIIATEAKRSFVFLGAASSA